MDFIKKISDVSEIIKFYLKKERLKSKEFADFLNIKPSALSRILNKSENMSAVTMLKLLEATGHEFVVMTKSERNLFENRAYAELYKESKLYRENIRLEIIAEIESDLKKSLANYFDELAGESRELSKSRDIKINE